MELLGGAVVWQSGPKKGSEHSLLSLSMLDTGLRRQEMMLRPAYGQEQGVAYALGNSGGS